MSKNRRTEKTIALFLITLAITMPVVFTSLMPEIKNNEVQQNSAIGFFANVIKNISYFFTLIPSASAADPVFGCCEITKPEASRANTFCQFVTKEQCFQPDIRFSPQKNCKDTSNCTLGCCIDRTTGSCSASSKIACENKLVENPEIPGTKMLVLNPNGYFDGSLNCNTPRCEMGCCDLGDRASYTTRTRCNEVLKGNFNAGGTESECVGSAQLGEWGCCVMPTTCKRTNMSNCNEILNGRFARDNSVTNPTYCSSLSDCSMCEKEKSTTCTDFDNNVHYMDSCGNIEGIVRGNPGGNCQANSQVCVQNKDGAICGGDCNITGANGVTVTRHHGESWCVYDVSPDAYDSDTLDFKDGKIPIGVMGSRDFRAVCLYGNEVIEPCADYRSQVCVQNPTTNNEAECVMNMWAECLTITDNETCIANKQCVWDANAERSIGGGGWNNLPNEQDKLKNVHSVFENVSCLPRYPPGFAQPQSAEACDGKTQEECKQDSNCAWDLGKCSSNLNTLDSTIMCGSVSYGKTVSHQLGGCKGNCDAETLQFAQAMAKKCSAIGDCGVTVNILNKQTSTESFKIFVTDKNNDTWDVTKNERDLNGGQKWTWGFLSNLLPDQSYFSSLERLSGKITGTKLTPSGTKSDFIKDLDNVLSSRDELYQRWFDKMNGLGLHNTPLGDAMQWVAGSAGTLGLSVAIGVLTAGHWASLGLLTAGVLGPIGLALLIIAVLAFLAFLIFGREVTSYYTYQCLPASPPQGGEDCTKCNLDPERPCSEYRCKSLGSACELVNPGTSDQICDKMEDNGVPPKITEAKSLTDNYFIAPGFQAGPPGGSFTITGPSTEASGCFKAWDTVLISFKTDKYSHCAYSQAPGIPFESMTRQISPAPSNTKNHVLDLKFPNELIGSGQHSLYIKCQDYYSHTFDSDFTVNFCVEVGPDTAAVNIEGTDYDYSSKKFSKDLTELPLQIHVNKPSDCRWDTDPAKPYNEMSATTQCTAEQSQSQNFNCNTKLTGLLPEVPNKFYIRCNSTAGVMNENPFELILTPVDKLEIISISPSNNEEVSGCEFQSQVTLKVETAGGSDEGIATCSWTEKSDYSELSEFQQTGSTYHETNITVQSQGNKDIYIKCQDSVPTIATNHTAFSVKVDNLPPIITRLYQEAGQLILVTNEPSQCAYDLETCEFKINRLTTERFDPQGENVTIHSTPWIENGQWYVKCFDSCGKTAECETIYPEEI